MKNSVKFTKFSSIEFEVVFPSVLILVASLGFQNQAIAETKTKETCVGIERGINAYAGVFYSNDFSYLQDPCLEYKDQRDVFSSLTDQAKRIEIAHNVVADFGGEYRLRYHHENNLGLSRLNGLDNEFLLQRLRLYGNIEVGEHLRFFGELIDARSFNETFGPRGIEEVHTDLLNGFVDFNSSIGSLDTTLRLGRQELLFGSQRLISPLNWGNTRRSFDGVRFDVSSEQYKLSSWYTAPRVINADFSSSTDDDAIFAGAYASYHAVPDMEFDFYALSLSEKLPLGIEQHHLTIGGRHAGSHDGLFWEIEGAGQFGERELGPGLRENDINAYTFTAGVGYNYKDILPWNPVVSIYYDRASGDNDPSDDEINTFDQLFPLAHAYFGFADLVARQNIESLSLRLGVQPHERVKLSLGLHQFWLESEKGALFNSGGAAIRHDPTGSSTKDVGTEIDITAAISLPGRAKLEFGYAGFFGGDFIDATNPSGVSSNAEFYYSQFSVKF